MHDAGWGWWLIMSIGMVAFWAIVVYGIVLLVRGGQRPAEPAAPSPPSPESPKEILRRRLASGEISVQQYRELTDALSEDGPKGSPESRSLAA